MKGTRYGLDCFTSHNISDAIDRPQTLGRLACRPGQLRPVDGVGLPPASLGADGVAARSVGTICFCIDSLDGSNY